jgi:hypothetical protein
MDGLLTTYKKDPKFLKLIKQMSISAEIIEDIMTQINENYPPPEHSEYDFSLKNKTLRIKKNS